jgi:hypothetical protein
MAHQPRMRDATTRAGEPRARSAKLAELAITSRPLDAYRDMFLLTEDELVAGPILDCPGGASSFGAQLRALGGEAVSVDPAYRTPRTALLATARADLDRVVAWHRAYPDNFNWDYLGSADALEELLRRGLDEFAADFALDGTRYVDAGLPALPFDDARFALSVSGFFLFVYPDDFSFDDHRRCLTELARVTAGEVRVYPVHDTAGATYPALDDLRTALRDDGVETELRSTGCTYVSSAEDRMLVCRRPH